jgi:hypothetical protein
MALEYELTLAGDVAVEEVAQRAFPDPADRPAGTAPLLSSDLAKTHGFHITVVAENDGYVEGRSDDGMWSWEPDADVSVTFRLDKFADRPWAIANMLTAVRRVLDSGSEDATLVQDGNVLLFTRFGGVLRKHNRDDWWRSYSAADGLIPG